MTKHFLSYLFLFPFLFFISCNGNLKNNPQKEEFTKSDKVQIPDTPSPRAYYDPFFIKSNDTISVYGPKVITRNIIQDKNGVIWFATYEGIINYDLSADQAGGKKFTNITNQFSLKDTRIFSLLEDSKGNIWFGSVGNAGVYKYDGKEFINLTTKDGLVNNNIECMIEDTEGNIWFGTFNGASSYDGKAFRNYNINDHGGNNEIHSIIQDQKGKIWIGTSGRVFYYDESLLKFSALDDIKENPFQNVRSIVEDKNGNLWFGGNHGLSVYNGRVITDVLSDFTGHIYEDKKRNIWISAGSGNMHDNMNLYRYANNSLPLDIQNSDIELIIEGESLIFGILEDTDGGIWFGRMNGICKYDGETFNYFREIKE